MTPTQPKMKTITINYPVLSLLEIRKQYPELFYKQTWYDNEIFAAEKAPAGIYELCTEPLRLNKTLQQQQLPHGYEVPPIAVVAYGIISHFKKTGQRLFEKTYVSTSSITSDGYPSMVGSFGENGLYVDGWYGVRYAGVGCGASRKLGALNPQNFEIIESLSSRILELEKFRNRVEGK